MVPTIQSFLAEILLIPTRVVAVAVIRQAVEKGAMAVFAPFMPYSVGMVLEDSNLSGINDGSNQKQCGLEPSFVEAVVAFMAPIAGVTA